MREIVFIQNTEELWECDCDCDCDYPLEKGEVFSFDIYEGSLFVEQRWLEVVDIEKDNESGTIKYITKKANVPWAKN